MNKKTRKTLAFFYGLVGKEKPQYFAWLILTIICEGFAPFINILLPKFLIDELLGARDITVLLGITGGIIVGNWLFASLTQIGTNEMYKLDGWFERYFRRRLSAKAMAMDFADTEDPKVLELCNKAEEGMGWYSGGLFGLTTCFRTMTSALVTLIGVTLVIAYASPLLFFIALCSVAGGTLVVHKINQVDIEAFNKGPVINRAFWYLGWWLSESRFGKDIRLYGSDDMMMEKCQKGFMDIAQVFKEQADGTQKWGCVNVVITTAKNIASYLYLGWMLFAGRISIGDFTMLVNAANSFRDSLQGIITQLQELQKKANFMGEYRMFMELDTKEEESMKAKGTETAEDRKKIPLIEFRNISFRYPRTEKDVLSNVSLTIQPGEHLSVVGLNGAGKTTFIKLLCRLYDVTEGEILIGGVNILDYDIIEYRKLLAVVFQDFKLFSMNIEDNILLGDYQKQGQDMEKFYQLCGIQEKVESLPDKGNTLLYKTFDESGIEPSGGEAQKIAIARALYKDAPVVILDEPTAALDPVAEYEIYNHFDKLVGGKTAVYISHRLSSCKFCDKIAVFSNHTIAEYGTHNELVSLKDGIYSEMFRAQAQYYL